ncbi:hypothetical protein LCGC14_1341640 [marine sediment metagenome]|uniref:Uncharacterized protein n=1 Tax=marine sediment metagenome TaxID=412755 RepID=A0A0F9KDF2_9ZZZZ
MKVLDLPAIKKLCEAAMPGPWLSATRASPEPHIVSVAALRADNMGEPVCELWSGKEATGDFIAQARTLVPQLVEELEEAQGGWNAAAAELTRHDCNVGEFGCSAPDSKGPCTKHQLAEAQGRIGAIREAAELAPEVAIATILAILGESE